jgi:hypothetical protein
MLIPIYQIAQHHIQEDCNLNIYYHENF